MRLLHVVQRCIVVTECWIFYVGAVLILHKYTITVTALNTRLIVQL